jgi:hypothetical protein
VKAPQYYVTFAFPFFFYFAKEYCYDTLAFTSCNRGVSLDTMWEILVYIKAMCRTTYATKNDEHFRSTKHENHQV